MNKLLLWMLLLLPLCGAVASYLTGRKNKKKRDFVVVAVTLAEAMGAAGLLIFELVAGSVSTRVENVLGLGIHFTTDGFRVTYLPVDKDGRIRLDALKEALCEETILVSIMYVNNEVGSVQPIEEAAQIIKKNKKKSQI